MTIRILNTLHAILNRLHNSESFQIVHYFILLKKSNRQETEQPFKCKRPEKNKSVCGQIISKADIVQCVKNK